MKMKIEQIGFEGENPFIPLILMSKAERENKGLDCDKVVRVSKKLTDGDNEAKVSVIAKVDKIFKQHLGKVDVCQVNKHLADKLEIQEGENVEVTDDVTESEYNQFQKNAYDSMFMGF